MAYKDPVKRREYQHKWHWANIERRRAQRRSYYRSNPHKERAAAQMGRMVRRLKILEIIGSECLNHPGRTPDIEHIADEGYWSGAEHRARVSCAGITRDLLRLHKAGFDIKLIVQPLCHSCNSTKRERWKANETLDNHQ